MSSLVLNVDLHCHSNESDGLLPPAEVARRASANGVDVLALTDHDNIAGLAEARAAADACGMGFVNGVEVSIEWEGGQVHIVGLAFAANDAALATGLAGIRSGRIERARRMAADLERVGIRGAFEGALAYAHDPNLVSRAHFARYLVEIGICRDVRSVFDAYLKPGLPGYVEHRWPTLGDALDWIHGAGGVAVVAHPGRYKFSARDLRRLLCEFKDRGGRAIEVVSGGHTPEQVGVLGRLAREFDFLASRGSDFHGPGESFVDLGKVASLPDGLTPVWTAF